MTIPADQINTAAEWWTFQLRRSAKVSSDQADLFESTLRDLLPAHLEKTWDPNEPIAGSSERCLLLPGGVLSVAAKAAGIPTKCPPFPKATTMWINPDAVKVQYGLGKRIVCLWARKVLSDKGGAE